MYIIPRGCLLFYEKFFIFVVTRCSQNAERYLTFRVIFKLPPNFVVSVLAIITLAAKLKNAGSTNLVTFAVPKKWPINDSDKNISGSYFIGTCYTRVLSFYLNRGSLELLTSYRGMSTNFVIPSDFLISIFKNTQFFRATARVFWARK